MKTRILIVFLFFTAFWSLLLIRTFVIQIFPHDKLERLEARQYETTVKIEGRRGSIYDRKGVELAISAPAYSLYADPQLLWSERLTTARQLQKSIGVRSGEFLKLVKDKKKRFVWVDRQLTLEQMEKVKALNIHGLGFIEEPKRIYPDEDILKSVLGTVGRTGHGMEGVEKQFDSVLKGNPKKLQVRRDARGRPIQVNGLLVTEAEEGTDVQLTLDRELQYVLHRELSRTMEEQQAQGALGIILDAKTSEVLAMDGVGKSMGNNPSEAIPWRNRPMLDAFEPGSTMKTFIIAAGIQKKGWQPNTKFNSENGRLKIGKRFINEADGHHHFGWLTISEILAFSSNIGMTKMAFELGEQDVKDILNKFGFGKRTGINLPGEAKGILQPGKWSQHLLSNVSFGHGIAATPLQIANAYVAIANGGLLNVPRITKNALNKQKSFDFSWSFNGSNKTKETERVSERILSETEAQTLRLLLAGVVVPGGTGVSAVVPGYPVAGKTGTAQKVNPDGLGYLKDVYISSFVGMIPANEPRFVIYVAVDSPKKQYYGSQVAAPLFSRIATFAVRHDGIAPRWLNEQQAEGLIPPPTNSKNKKALVKSPTIASTTDSTANVASTTKATETLASTTEASATETSTPMPMSPPSPAVAPATTITDLSTPTNVQSMMPNLYQLTLREMQEQLQNRDLIVKIHGSGKISRFIL